MQIESGRVYSYAEVLPIVYKNEIYMKINVTQQDNQIIIGLEGMLDSSSAAHFQDVVNETLESATTPLNIVLDLSNLAYTSSQGIRTILTLMKTVMARQGKLIFRNIQPTVREVFDMSGISQAMVIE